jgi:Family of unknown function (DUF6350)
MTVMEMLRGATSQDDRSLSNHLRHLLAGAGAAAASGLAFVLPALLVWVATSEATVEWTTSLGTGAALWLLATGAHLRLGGTEVTVVPLLFLGLAVVAGAWSARRAVRDTAEARTIRLRRDLVHGPLAAALAAWAGGYAVTAAGWALLTLLGSPRPVLWTLLGPVVLVPVLSAVLAGARTVRRRPELAGPALRRPDVLPDAVVRGLRPGLEGVLALVALGLVTCVVLVVVHLDRVSHLQGALSPGLVGGAALVLAQLVVMPNLALWAVSFMAGTGFSAVEGASATWTGSRTSLMPMVPVLGALPQPGAFPGWLPLVVLLPVAVGALVGWRSLRSVARLSGARTKIVVTGTAVLTTAGGLGLLDVLGGGSLGADRLAAIGAPAGVMTVALFVELSLGAALVLAWDRWKLRG